MEGCKFYQILNFFFEKPTADQILNFTDEVGELEELSSCKES